MRTNKITINGNFGSTVSIEVIRSCGGNKDEIKIKFKGNQWGHGKVYVNEDEQTTEFTIVGEYEQEEFFDAINIFSKMRTLIA